MSSPADATPAPPPGAERRTLMGRFIGWCLQNRLIVLLGVAAVVWVGVLVAPFDWGFAGADAELLGPVAVDAIPDIGENQQIVFTRWAGRSPQDVEDQITYPLSVSLLGVPGVRTIRSSSMFGFSTIYVIFEEGVDFHWSRSRILEKLASLPPDTLPDGVRPGLGPDATALGQIFWYTLEGRDPDDEPVGGWDLEQLRTIQDWTVRYALSSAEGVAEVASVGGFVREYQVDVDPDAMRAHDVMLPQVIAAVRDSNLDVGAKTIEMNSVEYFLRGVGFIENVEDIAQSVVKVSDNVPIRVGDVADVTLGPALRRGALDKGGAEAVGGVVVARYGENPLAVIRSVKEQIEQLAPGLPVHAVIDEQKVTRDQVVRYAERHGFVAYDAGELDHDLWLAHLSDIGRENWPDWVTTSRVTIVPFYDRTGLIHETLGTLGTALNQEILITLIVVILMVMHLRSSVLIGGMLPLAVLMCFIAMKLFGVDANIVALSGIAIAIGTIVDMGIVICENILRHLEAADPSEPRLRVVQRAAAEVGSAVLTAVATTVVSFLPVFAMIGEEGRLFRPLAFTKTFALIASILIALIVIPPAAHVLFCGRISGRKLRAALYGLAAAGGATLAVYGFLIGGALVAAAGLAVAGFAVYALAEKRIPDRVGRFARIAANVVVVILVALLLTGDWMPLGVARGFVRNFVFVAGLIALLLGLFRLIQHVYAPLLRWCLAHKGIFLGVVAATMVFALMAWLGFASVFGWVPPAIEAAGGDAEAVRSRTVWVRGSEAFPGLGEEFMPTLDEGSFLWMPTTMTHASIGEALDVLATQDKAFEQVPEIDSAVGKLGRAESALDPAPISMIETVITYRSEYRSDESGEPIRFREADDDTARVVTDAVGRRFAADHAGRPIPDDDGRPFRQWREHIRSPDDIWDEIVAAGELPGTTSAPKLQPIAARLVMLQSGMRAPMGIKIKGPDLESIERTALEFERLLKQVPSVKADAVIADRIVGKPYLEIVPDRRAIARYNVRMREFQDVVEVAIGGRPVTSTVEGRLRFPVRVRYPRERRDSEEALRRVLVPGADGQQVPIEQLARIRYVRGPQVIKSEDTQLIGYVLFDKRDGFAETDVVEEARDHLREAERSGEFVRPAGVTYEFAGSYENQVRAAKRLAVILPLALLVIVLILYMQFRSLSTTMLVFSGIFVAWAGGFILLWLYGRPWFMDFSVFGVNMRDLFDIKTVNLSVAVWVGFLALFGIASDNGVIVSTYLDQVFGERRPTSREEIREATVAAARRRVRPCLMTTATTILALIPVLTSTGRGSDVMVPMAIPSFGGMLLVLLTIFLVPVLYCGLAELRARRGRT